RRLFRLAALGARSNCRRSNGLGDRSARGIGPRGRTDGISSHRLLATDGYAARQERTGRALAEWTRAVESVELRSALPDRGFWQNKRVLLTGHTGFKGGWLALWLTSMGARVSG